MRELGWVVLTVVAGVALGTASWVRADGVERTRSTPGAQVYFISPHDGETVGAPVRVRFGLRGMGVAPAGVDLPGTGHHHLIIDAKLPPLDLPIPNDAQHRHFGAGQTETLLDLPAGRHTLQLLLGDARHVPHDPALASRPISIMVR
ncbi:MAG: DUF4399 domain-containing protein [Myxococcota bacterium]